MIAPKPAGRRGRLSFLGRLRAFRADILSAQPDRLYRAWMAELRLPFLRSYLCNDPALVRQVLKECPADFPKSPRVAEGLRPLLGESVFVTNDAQWERQRRLIDPAFDGGRLRDALPAMLAAGQAAERRFTSRAERGASFDLEPECSHAAADVIFRTLFSIPIEDETAQRVYRAFRSHQRAQPLLTLRALLPLARFGPATRRRSVLGTAAEIRQLIAGLVAARADEIRRGTAPDDLATRIMTAQDPQGGPGFSEAEMVDQVAIFFLAGHETSAAALAWTIWLLAANPDVQARVAAEAVALGDDPTPADIARLGFTRDVFRETLRLYPPVPMMVRQARCPVHWRGRDVPRGAQIVLSPWHLHRHERLWADPDVFDPDRWQRDVTRDSIRDAYLPFSAGPRICPGAGFAMIEGPLLLAMLIRRFHFAAIPGKLPVPVAHLTVRSRGGIPVVITFRSVTS
ncbi:MAG: cytochrome P450 [Paracoccaceae bacterium]